MDDVDVTRWWWVRHAPVVDAHLDRLSGQADVDADVSNELGFCVLAQSLPKDAVWIATPLKRTQQTVQALQHAGAEHGDVSLEADFSEQAFGDWTGQSWTDIGNHQTADAFWKAPTTTRPPGTPSESFVDVCARVATRIGQISAENQGRDIICVAHAGSIRAALVLALGLMPEQALAVDVNNLGLTRLDFIAMNSTLSTEGQWRVASLNQHGAVT